LGAKLNFSAAELSVLALELVEALRQISRFDEAAQIMYSYCKDIDQATALLLEGHHWEKAIHLIHSHNRRDLLDKIFPTAVNEAYDTIYAKVQEQSTKFIEKCQRLAVVRTNKLMFPQLEDTKEGDDEDETSTVYSESSVGSVASLSSISSLRTSKTSNTTGTKKTSKRHTRRQERKKIEEKKEVYMKKSI